MPTYRYYTADLLTGDVLGDVELYGVYMTKQLDRAGQFNGTIRLTDDKVRNAISVNVTEPGRTAMYVERDEELIWGGIIWSRTYASQSRTLQLSGSTFESYFDHVVFEEHFIQQKLFQENIFKNMVDQLQAQPSCDIGLTMATLPTTEIKRTVLIPDYEFHYANDALNQLVGVDLGLEYTIDVVPGSVTDKPDKIVRLGYPNLGSANSSLDFEFPGSILTYWMPESGARGGVKFAALGHGSGNKIARATATVDTLLRAGYPAWWIVNQYSTIADLGVLQDKVTKDAITYRIPVKSPTFDINPEAAMFDAWNKLGDDFTVHIEDWRYPNGYTIESRMIGWEFTPASSDSDELLKLVVDGAEV